jgi:tripartite-type tricarboxylate transporter receptor subunit TctC
MDAGLPPARLGIAPVIPGGLALTLVFGLAACAGGQRFPAAPILIVCPWAAGGGTDRVARQMAVLLEQDLGVPVNVVNATGGDGVTGHSRGALARPDGYTLTLITIEIATLHWRGMTSVSAKDFAPVGLVNRDAAAVLVRSDAPWRTLRDLEQAIRERPRSLRASGTATAGIWHLAVAGWLSTVGLRPTDLIWVSIAGSAPSLQELLAGGVDLVSCSLPEAQALLFAGRVRSLGVMADARLPQFPEVPTFREQGVDWQLGTLRGLGVPRDTPPERVAVLAAAVRRVALGEAYRSAMGGAGFTAAYEDPAAFAATLEQTDQRLGALLGSEAFRGLAAKQLGPMFFPAVLIGALVLVSGTLLVTGRKQRSERQPPTAGGLRRMAEVVAWILLYLALAETLGFILTAGALLLVHLLRLGTKPAVAVAVALLLVPAAYEVFAVLLRVPLPRGLLGW